MLTKEKKLGIESTPPKRRFGARKKQDQMRLVALQSGELRYVNDSFAASFGLGSEELIGRNITELVQFKSSEDADNVSEANPDLSTLQAGAHTLLLGRDQQKPYNFQFDWVRGHDGRKYLIASSTKEVRPEEWGHFVDQMRTPAERARTHPLKKISATSKSTSPFLQAVNDQSAVSGALDVEDMPVFASLNSDFMCVIDAEGDVKRFNNNFETRIKKRDRGNLLEAIAPEDRALAAHFLGSFYTGDQISNAVVLNTKSAEFEARMKTDKGEPLWMQWTIRNHGDELYCLGHDITAAKLNEISLKRHESELSEAQALAQMGHWRWVVGSSKIEWSEQIYKIFGVEQGEFEPTLDSANALVHKRDVGHMMQAFQRAIIEQNDYDVDFRVVRADGSVAYVRCEGRCELDTEGDVTALYGVMQDITEQTEYAMELRKAKDAAEQAYASKSRFLANMSHELRTPLNAIIGFADMLSSQMLGALGNEKYIDYAGNIKKSGEHLLDLITDILDMSKIEAGKYELDLETISLGAVVSTAMQMIESRAGEGVIALETTITGDGPEITADRRAVMQIMLNILSNAVKFTEPGGSITTSIEEFENHVTVRVKDTGVGIPANKLSAVLLPFEQVSTAFTRNHEGSGLGLTITKELAELHGGMISLESKEGEGTTASIRLPRDAGKRLEKR